MYDGFASSGGDHLDPVVVEAGLLLLVEVDAPVTLFRT